MPDPEDAELIDYPHVGVGMYLILKNSKRLFADAKFLYDNKKFHNSIPLFIISIEESLKAHELSIKLRKRESLSKSEWDKLLDHSHKLSHIPNFVIERLEEADTKELTEIAKKMQMEEYLPFLSNIININKAEMNITSQFQFLKEMCLYQNWNREFCEWDEFDYLSPKQQEELAFFIMKRAEKHLHELHFGIEYAVHILRRDGVTLTNLEYPKYNEFREIKDFDTKLQDYEKLIVDFPKYRRGQKIMETLLVKKSFAVIDQLMTNDIIKKCLVIAQRNSNSSDWYPHPVVKAIFLAMSGIKEKSKDGNYSGISDDADQTYEGSPMMYSIVIVSKKDSIIKIEKIIINEKEYDINDKIIEQILETELIIERYEGKEIPLEKMHEAYSKIGVKIRKLRDSEVEDALAESKRLIKENQLKVKPEMIAKIKTATKENWEELEPNVRSCIAAGYKIKIKPEKNTVFMTGYIDPIRKFKVRGLLYRTLLMQNEFLN